MEDARGRSFDETAIMKDAPGYAERIDELKAEIAALKEPVRRS